MKLINSIRDLSKLFLVFVLIIGMTGVVLASHPVPLFPMITSGQVVLDGEANNDVRVSLYVPRLDYTFYTTTANEGVYQFVWNALHDNWGRNVIDGEAVVISVCEASINPACSKDSIASSVPQRVDFSLGDGLVDGVPLSEYVPPPRNDLPPADPEVTPPADEPEAPVDGELSFSLWQVIAGLVIAAGAGGLGGFLVKKNEALHKGVGVKLYTGRDGKEKVVHKHPGIRGYHPTGTEHRLKRERHPKGMLNPMYEKASDGEWTYKG